MPKISVRVNGKPKSFLTTHDLAIGQIGVLADGEPYAGKHVLRSYVMLTLLEDPSIDWGKVARFNLSAIITPTSIIVEAEG